MEDSPLKIIYQDKGKSVDTHNLTYQQLISKLIHALKLNPHYYYRLAYCDREGDFITIQTQQEFRIFMEGSTPKKLYLDRINDSESHFQRIDRIVTKPKSPDLHQVFNAKKKQLDEKLRNFKEKLIQEMKKQAEIGMKAILKEGQIHNGFICSCCKMGPIEGSRFECIRCDYNLCGKCEEGDDHIHPLIKIRNETQALATKRNALFYDDQDLKYVLKERKKGIHPL